MIKFLKKYTDCCGYTQLYKNDELLFDGDYYHNKIDEYIKGYLKAYTDLNIEYEYKSEEMEICPCGCGD